MAIVIAEVIQSLRDTQGFTAADIEALKVTVQKAADLTDSNLRDTEPLQDTYAQLLAKLPHVKREDKDGVEHSVVDQTTDAYKDFMRVVDNMILDRLTLSPRYVETYVKVETPSGAFMWVNVKDHVDKNGKRIELDPAVYQHYTTQGALIDPRVRLKTVDADLVKQVIKPLRKKMEGAARTTKSRLRKRTGGGKAATDFGKRFAKLEKEIRAFYAAAKEEEFEVSAEAALKNKIKELKKIFGLGV